MLTKAGREDDQRRGQSTEAQHQLPRCV